MGVSRRCLDMDALSEILRGIRLTGSAFIDAELSAPWSVQTPTVADLAKRLAPHAGRIIPYHLIVEGVCTVRVGPEPPLVVEHQQSSAFRTATCTGLPATRSSSPNQSQRKG